MGINRPPFCVRPMNPTAPPASSDRAASQPSGGAHRVFLVISVLLTLFLGALDTLVMGAAMPTVVAQLGGLDVYSWVFSAYLLSRAISLPIFGKLADLFNRKHLFGASIGIFLAGSLMSGAAGSMLQLILARTLQGVGAGANFALVYILLADIAAPGKRGKMMSMASIVWGLASVLGPPIGGFIVNFFSWRWIFFINIPLGLVSLAGIYLFFEDEQTRQRKLSIDIAGALALAATILPLLTVFLVGGRSHQWISPAIGGLLLLSALAGTVFAWFERRAADPILHTDFFRLSGFRNGNVASFFSSFSIFSLAAFSPLFIQGALGKTPAEVGVAMIPLSLAWSAGALLCGQTVHRFRKRTYAVAGGVMLLVAGAAALGASPGMSLVRLSLILSLAGLGMGFVSIASLLVVQDSVSDAHLGVSTASHQFTRTLGGTIGVGVAGGLLNARFDSGLGRLSGFESLGPELSERLQTNVENLFDTGVQDRIPAALLQQLRDLVGESVEMVFWTATVAALICTGFCLMLPSGKRRR